MMLDPTARRFARAGAIAWLCLALGVPLPTHADDVQLSIAEQIDRNSLAGARKVSLILREASLAEAMAMLSKSERVNILLAKGVEGQVSVNLYEVGLAQAIRAIAHAAGHEVEFRHGTYFVVPRAEVGKYAQGGLTEVRTFKVQYSKPEVLEGIVKNHLSAYGKVTTLLDRKLLIVEDTPDFLARVVSLLNELDRQPRQILIEAKILEITLTDDESFGLDWTAMLSSGKSSGAIGVQGLDRPTSGLFLELYTPDVDLFLDALKKRGRVRTLSTPKLLALEDKEAETIIGNRQGYKVTTTINQVTTESIQFLESGVILKVKPSVDGKNRIMLDIHPEVSTGTVSGAGIPSLKTTEVSTHMLVESGQTVFIGGLIKQTVDETRDGVPVLGDIPLLGTLFSNKIKNVLNTETIVLITPRLVESEKELFDDNLRAYSERTESDVRAVVMRSTEKLDIQMDNTLLDRAP